MRLINFHFAPVLFLSIFVNLISSQKQGQAFAGSYKLDWEIYGDKITFTAVVETTGWIGIGFNTEAGKMDGAELVITGLRVQDTTISETTGLNELNQFGTEVYLYVYKGQGHRRIPITNHIWEANKNSSCEVDGTTTVTLTRALKPQISNGEISFENTNIFVIWAYGLGDDVSHQHLTMGSMTVNLFTTYRTTTESGTTSSGQLMSNSSFLIFMSGIIYHFISKITSFININC